jgi:hypothetical protein
MVVLCIVSTLNIVAKNFRLKITNTLLPASNTPTHRPIAASGLRRQLNRASSRMMPERSLSAHDTGNNIVPLSGHFSCLSQCRWIALHGFKESKELRCPLWDIFFASARLVTGVSLVEQFSCLTLRCAEMTHQDQVTH